MPLGIFFKFYYSSEAMELGRSEGRPMNTAVQWKVIFQDRFAAELDGQGVGD
jgi:hypothetical protein